MRVLGVLCVALGMVVGAAIDPANHTPPPPPAPLVSNGGPCGTGLFCDSILLDTSQVIDRR